MSPKTRHIKSLTNTTYEEPYAIIQEPTNATFISEKTMETNEEKEGVRQTSQVVHTQRRLAKDKEAEGQAKTTCFAKTMESKTVGFFT